MVICLRRIPAAIGLIAALFGSPCAAQDEAPAAPDTAVATSRDTYRLRVENAQFGRIEVSVDGGERFLLIGRVTKPATLAAPDPLSRESGYIVRSSGDGIAFAVAAGQVLKLLPVGDTPPRGKVPDCAILTDIKVRTGIFGECLPPVGAEALQEVGRSPWRRYPDGLTPTDETVFAFVVTLPSVHGAADPVAVSQSSPAAAPDPALLAKLAEVRKRLAETSEQYAGSAMARARDTKRPVLSGIVALRAKLPVGEPEPIAAVTYSIDGDIVSAQNTFPAAYGWDTARVPNGEHVVEVRALSKYRTVITRVRTLVVVDNAPQEQSEAARPIDKPDHLQ